MRPLVLVPGLMCDAGLFAGVLPALSRHRAVLLADVGRDDSMTAMAERLLGQLAGPFDLAGFSMGGMVAMEVARLAPARVGSLALMDTNANADAPATADWRAACIAEAARGGLARLMREEIVPRYFSPGRPSPEIALACLQTAEALGPAVFARQFQALAGRRDQHDTLAAHAGRALVLRGAEDDLCNEDSHRRMARALCRADYVEIAGAAHLSVLQEPEAVARALLDWLDKG